MVLVRALLHYQGYYHQPEFWQGLVAWPKKRHNLGPRATQAVHDYLVGGRRAYLQREDTEQASPLTRILDQWICCLDNLIHDPPTVPDGKLRQPLCEEWARLQRDGHLCQLSTHERPWQPPTSGPATNEQQQQKEDGDDGNESKGDRSMKCKKPKNKSLFSGRLGKMETAASDMNTRIETLQGQLIAQAARRNKDAQVLEGWHQEHDLTIASLSRLIVGLEARLENAERELSAVRKELDEHISGDCHGKKQGASAQRPRPSTGGLHKGQRPAWS